MAEAYTRLIEIKVKDTDLGRALNKLQNSLEKIEKKLDVIAGKKAGKGFDAIAKGAEKAAKATKNWEQTLKGTSRHFKAFDILGQGINKASSNILKFGKRALALDVTARSVKKLTEVFWKHSKSIDGAWKSLQKLEQASRNFIQTNNKLIQTLASVGVPLLAIGQYAPQIYNLGKAFRQLEYDVKRLDKIGRSKGFRAAVGEVIPKGNQSHLLGRVSKWAHAEQPKPVETLTGQTSPVTGFAELGSLDTRRKALANTKQIQEKLVALTSKHLQASIQVRKAMIGYNLELAKTKVVQGFVTADLWAMQKAWQGIVSTMKGAGNLIGGIFGGKFGGAGKGLGVITLSRSIEFLTGKLGFLNKAWIDNTNKVALWSARASEAITAVNIGYTALSKVLGAAQWTAGAITGFIKWEEQAMLSIRRINTARNNLDKRMAGLLDKGQNPLTGIGKWLRGESGERGVKAQLADKGESNQQRIAREIEVQQRLLKATNTTAKDYLQIQQAIFKLQKQQRRETERRLAKEVEAGKYASQVYKEEYDRFTGETARRREESIKRGNKLRADADKNIKAAAAERYKEIQRRWQLEESNHRREVQRIKERNQLAKQRRAARGAAMGRFGENVMLGAGFPMLFGGGPGAVAGGLTGAVTQSLSGSKGFGMQILFSALGQQIDALVGKISTLGKAFNDMNPDVDAVIGALGETNTAYGKHLEMLKKIKGEAAAMTEATSRLTVLIGKEGVAGLKKFGDDTQALANAWSKFATLINTSLAQWINATGILVGLTNALSRASRFKSAKRAANEGNKELTVLFSQRKGLQSNFMRGVDKQGRRKRWSVEEYANALRGIDDRIDTAELKRQGGLTTGKLFGKGADKIAALTKEKDFILEKIRLGDIEAEKQKKINDLVDELGEEKRQQITDAVEAVASVTEQYEAAKKLKDLYNEIGLTIKDGIVDAIEGAIQGTKTLGQVASSVLSSISRKLLDYAITLGLSALPGNAGQFFAGKLASGGPAQAGKTYLVGEKGPELFTPTSSGHVTPNDQLGGSTNIVVNVDASGSDVEGDQEGGRQLGEMLAAAIQSELIKQQRPGGLLTK